MAWAIVRKCGCCDYAERRTFTVSCTEHGPMRDDEAGFACTTRGCGARLAHGDIVSLVDAVPEGTPEPLALVAEGKPAGRQPGASQ